MSDLFETYSSTFNATVPAQALFFHYPVHNTHALRIEAPTIGKEFTDNSWIGTDPEGFLYYNFLKDLEQPTTYLSSQVTNPVDGKVCAKVEFFFTEDPTASAYAVFLAHDPNSVVTASDMNNYRNSGGHWNKLSIGQVTAIVEKGSSSNQIRMTADVIRKKAVFQVTQDFFPKGTGVGSSGTFSFKSISDLSTATFVGYGKDHVVFYKGTSGSDFYSGKNAKDFVGYFIPYEGTKEDELINSLGDVTDTQFQNVVWTDW